MTIWHARYYILTLILDRGPNFSGSNCVKYIDDSTGVHSEGIILRTELIFILALIARK